MPENKKLPCSKAADKEQSRNDDIRGLQPDKNCLSNQNGALDDPAESDVIVTFTPEEVNYFLYIYDEIIVKESRPNVVERLYKCCQFLMGDNDNVIQFLPPSKENKIRDINNNIPSEKSLTSVDSVSFNNSKHISTTDNNEVDKGVDGKLRNCSLDYSRSVNWSAQYDCSDPETEKDLKIKVFAAHLVSNELDRFTDLLCDLLLRRDGNNIFLRQMSLLILDILLSTRGLHSNPHIANDPLPLGDTPLIQAARSRDYDVILLLLRNGSDVNSSWMNFSCALELLLFSPTQQAQLPDNRELLRCQQLLLAAMNSIPWQHLQQLESLGYYPLIQDWKELLMDGIARTWGTRSGPPSLSHLCRSSVRGTAQMAAVGGLQSCVSKLPLPTILKSYITLDDIV